MKQYSQFIVSYDISVNKIRSKVEKILKDAGLKRIQYSVFEGYLPADRAQYMSDKFKNIERKQTHSIFIFMIKDTQSLDVIRF